jgi:hypothetical protein
MAGGGLQNKGRKLAGGISTLNKDTTLNVWAILKIKHTVKEEQIIVCILTGLWQSF